MTTASRTTLHRCLAALVTTLLMALTTVGLAAQPAQADDSGGSLKVSLVGDIDTFNPFLAILLASTGLNRFQYESLVGYGKNSEPVAGIAETWKTSPDGRTWTFSIPTNRKWSDDKPITAGDVAYTYNLIIKNEQLQEANGGLVTNIASVRATDPQTVEMTLKAPQASNPGQEIPIVPEHVWSKENPEKFKADKDVVGSGPFLLTSYKTGQTVEFKANPHFWRGRPKVDHLTFVSYKNSDAAVQGLKSGDVDLVDGLTPAQYESLKKDDNITVNAGIGRRYQAIAINPGAVDKDGKSLGDGNPALKDPVLRKAIFMAIDKETIVKRVLDGLGTVGETEVPATYQDFFGFAEGHEAVPFDLDAANKLLDDAGYKKGSDGIRVGKDGKPLSFRLMGRNTESSHAQMADFVKSWLKQIGIDVKPAMVTPDKVNEDSTIGKYDLYFTGWSLGPDPDNQLSMNTCASRPNADGSGNTSENNWCSPEFDRLFNAQHAELDKAKRAELVKQAFTTLYDAYVSDPIYYIKPLEAYRNDKVGGFITQPAKGGVILNQNGYWGLYGAVPKSGASDDDGGTPGWVWPAGIVVVIGAVGAAFLARRRGGAAEDRE